MNDSPEEVQPAAGPPAAGTPAESTPPESTPAEGTPAPGSRSLPVAAVVYAVTVSVAGLAIGAAVLAAELPRIPWTCPRMVGSYLLVALLFLGELHRFRVVRKDGDTDRLTVSSTFAVALVLTGPLALALIAQLLATGLDDLRRRPKALVVAFNQGQYVLTLVAVRAAFTLPLGRPLLPEDAISLRAPDGMTPVHVIAAALLASATYFAVNTVVVDIVVALSSRQPFLAILREDLRVQGLSSSILLGLAPVTAVVSKHSPLLVPLLVLPLIGVQRNAWIAAQRQHEALHDSLTGLPNRALFRLRVEQEAEQAATQPGSLAAVMLVDLDHFKEVNDTLGHQAGDGMLREVAQRMTTALPPEVTIARLGGDEFAVLLPASILTGHDSIAGVGVTAWRICGTRWTRPWHPPRHRQPGGVASVQLRDLRRYSRSAA